MLIETTPRPSFPLLLREGLSQAVPQSFGFIPGLQLEEGEPSCLCGPCDGMFAIMGFMGDFTWAYTLILPRNITTQFVQSFTGFEIAYHNPDMGDVVGELANVLAGDVISTLNSRRIVARMGLPTVARGTDVEFLVTEGTPSCAVGFHCEFGSFGFRMMLARPTRSWHRRVGLPFNG